MTKLEIIPLQKPITAEVTLPGSLSYTIRAMALAAMTKGTVRILDPLKSDDTYAMLGALQTLGIKNEEEENAFVIYGDVSDVKDEEYTINIRLSGRTARMLLALLCIVPGMKTLTCAEGFKKRPMKDLVDGLRQLGASIEYLETEGCLPVKITSNKLISGHVKMNGNISSQYFSAIMMIAPLVGDIKIDVIGEQASKPFIDVTIDTMREFGVYVQNNGYKTYTVKAHQKYSKSEYQVEPDATAASYFWSIAAVTKSTIKVLHVSPESKQGDVKFVDALEKMGCTVIKNTDQKWISVQGNPILRCIKLNMNSIPDVVPTMAVVATFAKGETGITGLEHLKGKESDRIEAPKSELIKMGATVTSTDNSLSIEATKLHSAKINPHGDHRLAMAFAVAGTKIPGVVITNPEVVNKSFPNFWETLEEIGVSIKNI